MHMDYSIPGMFWIIIIVAAVLNICMIVWFYELKENSKTQTKLLNEQNALLEQQNKINTAQLHLLAGLADKTGVPVNDINEVVTEFGIEYE